MNPARLLIASCLLLAGAVAALPAPMPGPPGLCAPFEIGDASKPLDAAFKDLPKHKVAETLIKLLDENAAHATVRMEVIRRAVFARETKAEALDELALHVTTRALLAKGADKDRAAAIFDAGYFIYTASVLGAGECGKLAVQDGTPGYALVVQALGMNPDPEMQVGACYVTLPAMHAARDDAERGRFVGLFRGHAEKAARGSTDPLVTSNLKAVLSIEGLSLEQLAAPEPNRLIELRHDLGRRPRRHIGQLQPLRVGRSPLRRRLAQQI